MNAVNLKRDKVKATLRGRDIRKFPLTAPSPGA